MLKRLNKSVLVSCWLLMSAPLAAGDAPAQLQRVLLAEDVSATATLEAVLAGQLAFRPVSLASRINLGVSNSAFWLRIWLKNDGDKTETRWLAIGQARLQHVSLFNRQSGQLRETRGGMAVPFSSRAIPMLSQVFELDLAPHSTEEVLVRVAGESVMVIEPGLWKPEQFMQQEWRIERVVYFASGILALALLFGLLLTVFAHEPAFFVYGLAALFYLLFLWAFSGMAYRELWPESPAWALHSIGFFMTLSALMLLWVHRLLLKTAHAMPRLDRVVRLLMAGFLFLAVLMAVSPYYSVLVLLMMVLMLLLTLGSPVLGFFAARHGVPFCGYGLAAYVLPWQVSQLYYFASLHWQSTLDPWVGLYWVLVALLLSSVLILGGLVDQLNRARRAHAQQELGQRERLEVLVKERTFELQQAKTVAEQTLDDQRQFLAMVSHEVRSPLASIKTATQLLELQTENEESLAILQRILRGAQRMTQFFDNYLSFDRLDTQQWVLSETRVDLPALLQTLCEQDSQANTHELQLSIAAAVNERRWLYADAPLLSVLLNNLLENARKYSPVGSVIKLSARIGEDGGLCLSVSDQGVGITENELEWVFNKFFRSTQVGRVAGAGLGLYLVRQIAGLHGGFVKVKSQLGRGTTVTLTLPQYRWNYGQ